MDRENRTATREAASGTTYFPASSSRPLASCNPSRTMMLPLSLVILVFKTGLANALSDRLFDRSSNARRHVARQGPLRVRTTTDPIQPKRPFGRELREGANPRKFSLVFSPLRFPHRAASRPDEQPPSRRSVLPPDRGHPAFLPARRRDRARASASRRWSRK